MFQLFIILMTVNAVEINIVESKPDQITTNTDEIQDIVIGLLNSLNNLYIIACNNKTSIFIASYVGGCFGLVISVLKLYRYLKNAIKNIKSSNKTSSQSNSIHIIKRTLLITKDSVEYSQIEYKNGDNNLADFVSIEDIRDKLLNYRPNRSKNNVDYCEYLCDY